MQGLSQLLRSCGLSKSNVSGILDISRCQFSTQCSLSLNKFELCSSGEACSDDFIITYFVNLEKDNYEANSELEEPVKNKDVLTLKTQWCDENLLLNNYGCLAGAEPLIHFKFVESKHFSLLPASLVDDWFCQEVTTNSYSPNSIYTSLKNNASNKTHDNFRSPMHQFMVSYGERVNCKISPAIQETLFKTANIEEDEIAVLRQLFYASSFPSRFLNCHNFCTSLCDIILGEMDGERQRDFFRFVISV